MSRRLRGICTTTNLSQTIPYKGETLKYTTPALIYNETITMALEVLEPKVLTTLHLNEKTDTATSNNEAERGNNTEFGLFGKLPAELQLKIWKMAIQVPRIIHLDFTFKLKKEFPEEMNIITPQVVSRTRPPAMLHTCQNSRAEASKVYQQFHKNPLVNPIIYNPSLDTILMNSIPVFHAFVTDFFGYFGSGNDDDDTIPMTRVAVLSAETGDRQENRPTPYLPWAPFHLGQKIARDPNIQHVSFIKDFEESNSQPQQLVIHPSAIVNRAFDAWYPVVMRADLAADIEGYDWYLTNVEVAYEHSKHRYSNRPPKTVTLECCTLKQLQARHG